MTTSPLSAKIGIAILDKNAPAIVQKIMFEPPQYKQKDHKVLFFYPLEERILSPFLRLEM